MCLSDPVDVIFPFSVLVPLAVVFAVVELTCTLLLLAVDFLSSDLAAVVVSALMSNIGAISRFAMPNRSHPVGHADVAAVKRRTEGRMFASRIALTVLMCVARVRSIVVLEMPLSAGAIAAHLNTQRYKSC